MAVIISMLRGVNLGKRRIKMDALRELCASLELDNPQTYVQSGNVIFETKERNLARLAVRIEDAIQRKFGFHSDVILRTTEEMRGVIGRNPFAGRKNIEPGKLVVTFLAEDPGEAAREAVREIKADPEELWIDGRELYIYFPQNMGRTKLPVSAIGKILKTPGTARNWNSVSRVLEMAELRETS